MIVSTTPNEPRPECYAWEGRGQYTQLNGHKIFYLDEGDHSKPTLLLIHGFPTSSWDWFEVWPQLAQHYRLVALDLLGFGLSDKPNHRRYSILQQADLVEALVEQLQLKRFSVLAHDYGDTVTQELLARQIEGSGIGRWNGVCFLNGGLFPETHQALFAQKVLLSPLGPLMNALLGRKQFDAMLSKIFGPQSKPTEQQLAEFWYLINVNSGKHIFHNGISYMKDRITYRQRWLKALQQSPVPVAVINGSADPVSGAHMVARYQELNCRLDYLVELPSIGHYPQVEAPAEVARHTLGFFNRLFNK